MSFNVESPLGISLLRDTRARSSRALVPAIQSLEARIAMSGNPSSQDPSGGTGGGSTLGSGLGYSFTNWPVNALNGIQLTPRNTYPIVGPTGQGIRVADWIMRDPFPIHNKDGSLAKIGGWYVVAGLATPRNDAIGTLREIDYIISRDGVNWQEGGTLISSFQPNGLGDQLFSGDIVYDKASNLIRIFYTPVQGSNASEYVQSPSGPQMRQEIAVATMRPVATARNLTFTDFKQYGVRLRPDGNWYATPEQANTETEVHGFRDPFFFHDPKTGKDYLLFCANWGSDQKIGVGSTGSVDFPNAGPQKTDPKLPRNDAVIGIAEATDKTLTNWKLLPPLFGAIGVNEQTELPHIIYQQGRYYLFTSTHDRTFVGDLKYKYPEGMYGFVSKSISGPWMPLNGTGLVVANPPQDPLQTYAWKAVPIGGGRVELVNFINKGNSGTIAPVVVLTLKANSAIITQHQPMTGSALNARNRGRIPLLFGLTQTTSASQRAAQKKTNSASRATTIHQKAIVGIPTPRFSMARPASRRLGSPSPRMI